MGSQSPSMPPRAVHQGARLCAAVAVGVVMAWTGAVKAQQPAPVEEVASPVIVSPRVLYSPTPSYPAEGGNGVVGRVVLKVVVETDGTVGDVELVESLGSPFDELAIEAARRSVFTPAARDGELIAARALHKFEFSPEAPTQAAPEVAPETVATVGELGGVARVDGADVPLPGATVRVVAGDGTTRNVVTGEDGAWRVGNLGPGMYRVTVASDGFAPITADERVAAGEATEVIYRLASVGEGVEINVVGERPPREVTRRTITRREMLKVPGTGGDALRSIQSLPGVARPPGLAGLLLVRGSAPQDTLTFIDGTYVPLIYHFGGFSSVVPTELLDRIDFYPGNFSARYGRAMGGIVDVGLRDPNTQCVADYGRTLDPGEQTNDCFHGTLEVDLINARAVFQGPIGAGWTFAVAGRRSYADSWAGPLLSELGSDVTTAPVYYDWQAIAQNQISRDTKLSLRFYGSDDRFEITTTDTFAGEPGIGGGNVVLHTAFMRLQGVFESKLTSKVDLRSMLSFGFNDIEFGIAQVEFDIDSQPIDWRNELSFQVLPEARVNVGMDFQTAPFDVRIRAPEPPRPGEPSSGPFTLRPLLARDDSGLAFRPGWYAEAEVKPVPRLLVVPGVRLDYARDSRHTDVSPRVSARYDLIGGDAEPADERGNKRRRTTIKGGLGVFYQPPQFQETAPVFGTPDLGSNQAIHYSLGVEQEITDQIELSVEGFYKDLSSLVSREAFGSSFEYANGGTGSVVGAETLLKYNADERFFGWLAYTLSRSVRTDGPGQEEHLAQYDQTHIMTILGSYRLGDGWEVGLRFRLVSGPLYTPTVSSPSVPAVFASDAAAYTQLTGEPFSERLPLFHQLDVRLEKGWQFRAWRLSAYLDVWNAYNNPAKESLSYNFDYSRSSFANGLPFIPSLGVRGEF